MTLLYRLCKRGHERSPENVSWSLSNHGKPQGKCKQCHALMMVKRYHERKTIRSTTRNTTPPTPPVSSVSPSQDI